MQKVYYLLAVIILSTAFSCLAQEFPGADENIPFLVTFGNKSNGTWGDDDYLQVFFFKVPANQKDPFFIRVFDPDCGGDHDEEAAGFDSQFRISVFGGKETISHPAARKHFKDHGYDSGDLLDTKMFAADDNYDDKWYSFGPFNPIQGELIKDYGGRIFKIIVEGISGDDGNAYKFFLSRSPDQNLPVEGGNGFTFEYTLRMPSTPGICHLYPYIRENVIAVEQFNFDWDNGGILRIVSLDKQGEKAEGSAEGHWSSSRHEISQMEWNTSLDFQLIIPRPIEFNNVVFRLVDQVGNAVPIYSIPIGGKPTYTYQIGMRD